MVEIINQFKYTGPLRKERDRAIYVERENLMNFIFPGGELTRDWYIIHGFGQSGKTTCLYEIGDRLRETKGMHQIFLGFQQWIKNEESLLRFFKRKLRAWEEDEKFKESKHVDEIGPYIVELGKNTAEKNERAVFLMDDVRHIGEEPLLCELLQQLRAAFHGLARELDSLPVTIIIATSMDLHRLLLEYVKESPFTNVCKHEPIENFTQVETEWLVKSGFEASGVPMSKLLANAVYRLTGGHPSLTQQVCSLLIENWVKTGKEGEVALDNLPTVTDRIQIGKTFGRLEEAYRNEEFKPILRAIYLGETIPFTRANRDIYELELMGILCNKEGRCSFNNPMIEDFLETKMGIGGRLAGDPTQMNILVAGSRGMGKTTYLKMQIERHIKQATFLVLSGKPFIHKFTSNIVHKITRDKIPEYVRAADFSFYESADILSKGKVNICSPPELSQFSYGLLLSLILDNVKSTLAKETARNSRYVFVLDNLPRDIEVELPISQLNDLTRQCPNVRFWWATESVRNIPQDVNFHEQRFFRTSDKEGQELMQQRKPGINLEKLAELPVGMWL